MLALAQMFSREEGGVGASVVDSRMLPRLLVQLNRFAGLFRWQRDGDQNFSSLCISRSIYIYIYICVNLYMCMHIHMYIHNVCMYISKMCECMYILYIYIHRIRMD